MWRPALVMGMLAALVAIAPGCEHFEEAVAYRIASLDQAIGGPVAYARVGDFILKNDQIMVGIESGRMSSTPVDVGGAIVDMDFVRREEEFRGGRGLDQLGQIMPVANLAIARATKDGDVRITRSQDGAEVTASAVSGGVQKIIDGIGLLVARDYIDPSADDPYTRFYNEYELRPGERFVRVKTTLGFGVPFCPVSPEEAGCNEECDDALYDDDCKCPKIPPECTKGVRVIDADTLPDRPGGGLIDLFMGDLPRPLGTGKCKEDSDCNAGTGEVCVAITRALGGDARVCRKKEGKDAGLFMGDMLLFGGHLSVFVQGTGYDTESDIRRLFDKGQDTLASPLQLPDVIATGDRVSYAYAVPRGQMMVPVFGGPFSLGATAGIACRHDNPRCLERTLVRFERWISVGNGDVSSAREPIARARGDALGTVLGNVYFAHSAKPVSGAQVYALSDPRTPCEGTCKCPSHADVSDEELAGWTIDQLFEANRCRTKSATYIEGYAGVESMALTDPGNDYVRDGNYRLALPPGRYVLVAQHGSSTHSSLAPIEVVEGETSRASFYLVEPGRLDYAIFDEKAEPTAGKLIVSQCLPGKPCRTDDDCRSEGDQLCNAGTCSCQQTLLKPLELGGGRMTDGTLMFDQTSNGHGSVELPPGDYELTFAHGPQSTVAHQSIHIDENTSAIAKGVVTRVVDRRGWAATDFHVHSGASLDSGLPMRDRVTSFVVEDMDFMSSSDHDVLTRYEPLIEELGLRNKLSSQIGVETTTQELGHFISYPMRYEERDPEGNRLPGNNAPEWRDKKPADIFATIRERRIDDDFVVSVPHPFSYFDYYHLDPVSLEPQSSISTFLNPLTAGENFSGDFDAMEIINGKGFDLIRRPTMSEVQFYSQGLDELIARQRSGKIDEQTYQRLAMSHATETVRRMLHRTRAEQAASLAGEGADFPCSCGSTGDCSAGLECNRETMTCGVPPFAPAPRPLPLNGMCRIFRGMVDDWFNLLNRNMRRAVVGGSDVHGLFGYEAGSPRTLLHTGEITNPYLRGSDVARAILGFKSVVTNGPMIHMRVNGGEIGDTVTASAGEEVTISLRVEKGPFYDVDRVELYRNGELIHWATACGGNRREGDDPAPAGPCVETGDGVVAYAADIVDKPPRDAWYVTIALGLDGRPLSPVYASAGLSRFGTFEVTQRLYDLIPVLTTMRTPRYPSVYPTFPIAITNPIWVDVGGDGWKGLHPSTSWCTSAPRDPECAHR